MIKRLAKVKRRSELRSAYPDLDHRTIGALVLAYVSVEGLRCLTDTELLRVGGIGQEHLRRIRKVLPAPPEVPRRVCPACGGTGFDPESAR